MTSGLKTAALLGGLSALFLLIGGYLGGEQGMIVAFGFAVVMNIGSYWFSDKIVLRMYSAREVGSDHPRRPACRCRVCT
jgi:heat shock protein HtpX